MRKDVARKLARLAAAPYAFRYVNGPDKAGAARATQAMLRMKKLDVQALKAAYEGR